MTRGDVNNRAAGVLVENFILVFVDPGEALECIATAVERGRVIDFLYTYPDAALTESTPARAVSVHDAQLQSTARSPSASSSFIRSISMRSS